MNPDDAFSERLAAARSPHRGAARTPMLIGSLLVPLGILLIFLGWLGAAHTPVLQEVVTYGISGGLIGLALVVIGCFLYFSHWQAQQIRETRAQTAQLAGELQSVQSLLGLLVGSAAQDQSAALVATPSGTLSHRPSCQVVTSRTDVRPADAGLSPCRICQPA